MNFEECDCNLAQKRPGRDLWLTVKQANYSTEKPDEEPGF